MFSGSEKNEHIAPAITKPVIISAVYLEVSLCSRWIFLRGGKDVTFSSSLRSSQDYSFRPILTVSGHV